VYPLIVLGADMKLPPYIFRYTRIADDRHTYTDILWATAGKHGFDRSADICRPTQALGRMD
jgi:hypothetical protein